MALRDVERFVTDEQRVLVPVLGRGSLAAMRSRGRAGVGRGVRQLQRADEFGDVSPLRPSATGLHGGVLVLTPTALFLLATRAGLIHHRAYQEVARRALPTLTGGSFTADDGRLVLRFGAEDRWEFDVVRRSKAEAELLVAAIARRDQS